MAMVKAKRKMSAYERLRNGEQLNRTERRQVQQLVSSGDPTLEVVHRNAGGIDAGSKSHFVAVPGGRDPEKRTVREFGAWTEDLWRMAEWLKSCRVDTVAVQSTGVYWIALQEVLEKNGIQVDVVNARGTKNLPGRKSDVQECQWLMKLHTYGLLRNSFRPPEEVRGVRTLWRHRERLVGDAGRAIQQMQKALLIMNIQLPHTISDVSGVTGMAIIRAILQGERDPRKLAQLRDRRIKASEEEIVQSLQGHWRDDVLFELQQVLAGYDFLEKQIQDCDQQVCRYLVGQAEQRPAVAARVEEGAEKNGKKKRGKRKQGKRKRTRSRWQDPVGFDLRTVLHRLFGVDLTRIDGIDVMTALKIYTELGPDLRAFPDEGAFCSWLELVPRKDITGGKVIRQKARQSKNRVAGALRMAAESLSDSDSYLGARYRRMRGHKDGKPTVKAMAHYLARLVYRMLTRGEEYVDRGAKYFEKKREEREMVGLQRKAAQLGMKLVPAHDAKCSRSAPSA
jgi:transposase